MSVDLGDYRDPDSGHLDDQAQRIVSELGLDIEREARELAERAAEAGIANGRNPGGCSTGSPI